MPLALIIAASVAALYLGVNHFVKLGDDNPIEEVAEVVIKEETGMDIDLTPDSPEKK